MSVNIRIEISILKVFILTALLIRFGHCDEYIPERDYMDNQSLLRFLRNGKLNPEKAFHLMETNLEFPCNFFKNKLICMQIFKCLQFCQIRTGTGTYCAEIAPQCH